MTLSEAFDKLPAAERAEVFRLLHEAVLRRGGGIPSALGAVGRLRALADVFARNGCEIEEYT